MWRVETQVNRELYHVRECDACFLRYVIREAISKARHYTKFNDDQIWITCRIDDGYTRFVINVDRNFVCYKNTDSDYTLINIREGSIFNV